MSDRPEAPRRRFLLSGASVASAVALSGCSGSGPLLGSGSDDPNRAAEVIVENLTDEEVKLAVYLTDLDGESQFSRVYELAPMHRDETGSFSETPRRVAAFTDAGESERWRHPDETLGTCGLRDVQIRFTDEGLVYLGPC